MFLLSFTRFVYVTFPLAINCLQLITRFVNLQHLFTLLFTQDVYCLFATWVVYFTVFHTTCLLFFLRFVYFIPFFTTFVYFTVFPKTFLCFFSQNLFTIVFFAQELFTPCFLQDFFLIFTSHDWSFSAVFLLVRINIMHKYS